MVNVNIERLLKKEKRSKYWLCQKMNITSRNLNRIIRGETTSISFNTLDTVAIETPASLATSFIEVAISTSLHFHFNY